MAKLDLSDSETIGLLVETQRTLETRRKSLVNQIDAVDGILSEIRRLLDQLEPARTPLVRSKPGPASVIKPAIEQILQEANGQPLHADEILAAVRAKGISVSEKDPKATIVTALLRMHRNRMAHNGKTGVEKLGGNRFRWIQGELDSASEQQQPSALFPGALLALASQHELSRP